MGMGIAFLLISGSSGKLREESGYNSVRKSLLPLPTLFNHTQKISAPELYNLL